MQTMAASVASMGGMARAHPGDGLARPARSRPPGSSSLYFLCIGMFGVGVGMLYTPILVDRLQLTYPSGLAVANILRALTDKRLLKRSVGAARRRHGARVRSAGSRRRRSPCSAPSGCQHVDARRGHGRRRAHRRPGHRRAALIGRALTPVASCRSAGSTPGDPFRKIGFLIALGMIMGAAIVDLFADQA